MHVDGVRCSDQWIITFERVIDHVVSSDSGRAAIQADPGVYPKYAPTVVVHPSERCASGKRYENFHGQFGGSKHAQNKSS